MRLRGFDGTYRQIRDVWIRNNLIEVFTIVFVDDTPAFPMSLRQNPFPHMNTFFIHPLDFHLWYSTFVEDLKNRCFIKCRRCSSPRDGVHFFLLIVVSHHRLNCLLKGCRVSVMNTLLNPPVGGRCAPEMFGRQRFVKSISEESISNYMETTLERAMWLLRCFDILHLEAKILAR